MMEGNQHQCLRCLFDEQHPWHDDGTPNYDERYEPGGPMGPPRHVGETDA